MEGRPRLRPAASAHLAAPPARVMAWSGPGRAAAGRAVPAALAWAAVPSRKLGLPKMSPTDAHSTGAQAAAPAEQAAAPGLGCLWCLFPEPRRQKAAVVAVAPPPLCCWRGHGHPRPQGSTKTGGPGKHWGVLSGVLQPIAC